MKKSRAGNRIRPAVLTSASEPSERRHNHHSGRVTLFRFRSDTVSGIINTQTRFFQTGIDKRKISEVDWPGMWLLRPLYVCLCVCQAVSDLSWGVSCYANCHSNCFHFSVSILPQIFMSTRSFDFMLVIFPKACLIIRIDILASCRVCLHGCDD